MSLQEAEELLHKSSYSTVIVKAKNLTDVTPLATQLTDIYGSSARILTTQQLLQETSSIIGSITLLLGVVAGISLLVAAIGIMNIMLIAVYERTHEIGIMKSLGFKRSHILLIFLTQAMIIGLVGGVSGIVVGAGASYSLSAIFASASASSNSTATSSSSAPTARGGGFGGGGGAGGFGFVGSTSSSSAASSFSYSPVFTPETVVLALLVAVVVSVIAGMYPAWRASKMEPIDALRQL
jgi:ABC-type antimicrobial peptide transport system permease subunit